jgi:prepilin-type N-terminal cleavage/methylation domain-containing protein
MGTNQRGFTVLELLIILAIIGILGALIAAFWQSRNDHVERIDTNEWQCLRTEERDYTYPMLVGKITIMQKGRRVECVEWRRLPD